MVLEALWHLSHFSFFLFICVFFSFCYFAVCLQHPPNLTQTTSNKRLEQRRRCPRQGSWKGRGQLCMSGPFREPFPRLQGVPKSLWGVLVDQEYFHKNTEALFIFSWVCMSFHEATDIWYHNILEKQGGKSCCHLLKPDVREISKQQTIPLF